MHTSFLKTVYYLTLCHCLVARSSTSANVELYEVGDALRRPGPSRLADLVQRVVNEDAVPDLHSGLKTAALVYAFSTGDQQQIDAAVKLLDESATEPWGEWGSLRKLGPIELAIDPIEISYDSLAMVAEIRKSIVQAAMIGNTTRIQDQLEQIERAGLPAEIAAAISQYAKDALAVAELVPASPLKAAVNVSLALERRNILAEDRAYEEFAAYVAASPEEREEFARNRGGTNEHDVMKEVAAQTPQLIEALSKIREQYWAGELKRAEAIIKMQEAIGNSLDLKLKRAVIYWQLKELREGKTIERRQRRVDQIRTRAEELRNRTLADVSPNWPTVFQHAALRDDADRLLLEIRSYARKNSGALSACYAKCNVHIRKLDRRLCEDLSGVTIQQRAVVRSYLRELDEALQEPFDPDGALYALATERDSAGAGQVAAGEPTTHGGETPTTTASPSQTDGLTVALTLSGDERELASYAVFQAVLGSMLDAGTDSEQLSEIARMIRESSLLNATHRTALQRIGSMIYRGEINVAEISKLDDPVSTLARIAGVVGDDQFASELPEATRAEAFEILVADLIRKPSEG